jgi:hypothetical protein
MSDMVSESGSDSGSEADEDADATSAESQQDDGGEDESGDGSENSESTDDSDAPDGPGPNSRDGTELPDRSDTGGSSDLPDDSEPGGSSDPSDRGHKDGQAGSDQPSLPRGGESDASFAMAMATTLPESRWSNPDGGQPKEHKTGFQGGRAPESGSPKEPTRSTKETDGGPMGGSREKSATGPYRPTLTGGAYKTKTDQ